MKDFSIKFYFTGIVVGDILQEQVQFWEHEIFEGDLSLMQSDLICWDPVLARKLIIATSTMCKFLFVLIVP